MVGLFNGGKTGRETTGNARQQGEKCPHDPTSR
jgi:hypothetical protein